jgi:hypothetical protein
MSAKKDIKSEATEIETQHKSKKWEAKPSHKLIHTMLTILITLVVVGVATGAYKYFLHDTQTTIKNDAAPAIVKTVVAPNAARAHFDEADFSMDLPSDWKRLTPSISTYAEYKYQASQKNADNRYLSVYVDRIPLDMAVNKEVALQSNGDSLSHGNVSDNCTTFTTKATPSSLKMPAKWDGVSFLCDMDAVTRNVVGTSSPSAVNSVTLTNVGFTEHKFFFVFEDDNYNPDYGIMYNMLDSFKVK